jgi:ABC-type molybdate transport system ATPase subunit
MFPEEFGLVKDSIKSFIVDKPCHAWQSASSQKEETTRRFEGLIYKLGLKHLLDLPLVALSNGQTRRARIFKALLAQPELLLLNEPLSA